MKDIQVLHSCIVARFLFVLVSFQISDNQIILLKISLGRFFLFGGLCSCYLCCDCMLLMLPSMQDPTIFSASWQNYPTAIAIKVMCQMVLKICSKQDFQDCLQQLRTIIVKVSKPILKRGFWDHIFFIPYFCFLEMSKEKLYPHESARLM